MATWIAIKFQRISLGLALHDDRTSLKQSTFILSRQSAYNINDVVLEVIVVLRKALINELFWTDTSKITRLSAWVIRHGTCYSLLGHVGIKSPTVGLRHIVSSPSSCTVNVPAAASELTDDPFAVIDTVAFEELQHICVWMLMSIGESITKVRKEIIWSIVAQEATIARIVRVAFRNLRTGISKALSAPRLERASHTEETFQLAIILAHVNPVVTLLFLAMIPDPKPWVTFKDQHIFLREGQCRRSAALQIGIIIQMSISLGIALDANPFPIIMVFIVKHGIERHIINGIGSLLQMYATHFADRIHICRNTRRTQHEAARIGHIHGRVDL